MITFKVIKSYPFSKFSLGDQIQFIDDINQLKTKERELFNIIEKNPEFFEKQLDQNYFVILKEDYAILKGKGGKRTFENVTKKYFDTEAERDMFYAKNRRLFSYEDIAKLPLEANQLEFFMQTIKKLVNENKSTD